MSAEFQRKRVEHTILPLALAPPLLLVFVFG